ncbi:MAG: hypothetical protein WC412_00120 [Candidatus Omnitrophota bacterium]
MDIIRLRNLVAEYKDIQKKLGDVRAKYEKIKITYEIRVDLERELADEIAMAKYAKNEALMKYWQEITTEYFSNDKELANKVDLEKVEKEIILKNEKLISYYEKKLKTIKKQLGARVSQLIDNYEERNVLMGEESSTKKSSTIISEEDETELDRREKERKNSATFDKM